MELSRATFYCLTLIKNYFFGIYLFLQCHCGLPLHIETLKTIGTNTIMNSSKNNLIFCLKKVVGLSKTVSFGLRLTQKKLD